MTKVRYFEEGIVRCPIYNKFIRVSLCNDCDYLDGDERDRIYCSFGEPETDCGGE